jgi:hypothetical protein
VPLLVEPDDEDRRPGLAAQGIDVAAVGEAAHELLLGEERVLAGQLRHARVPVQADGAKAMLTHGVLTVSLPIAEKETNPRIRIEVAEPPAHQDQGR